MLGLDSTVPLGVVVSSPPKIFGGVWLLLDGGLCYTAGVIFYAWKRLPFSHAIWHLFVLAGNAFHVFAVL